MGEFIVRGNIRRFEAKLREERDPAKRKVIEDLLSRERRLLDPPTYADDGA